jgi:beta-1,4-mannosyl-glycoprotein beta-1,4-N-acetylglucosaminyltransferase
MDLIITEKSPTVCLNMIVKNEAHIILNTLTKLCKKIKFDYWVICDTGSTDDTPTIITEFFEKRGIMGELFFDEWVNFAHNRTLALERAYKKTDLLLVFDADDEICGNITIPKEVLHDEYQLKFGSNEGVAYIRVLLINNHKKFEYRSVVHEFICSKEPNSRVALIDGDYYVVSGRAGSRNKDPEKYLKDAQILEKAYADAVKAGDLLFHRYAFYCANSYKDYGDTEQAIKWYKIVLSQEGQWAQEKYMSCLYLGENYEKLQQKETGFFYLIKAFQYDTERVECLFPLLVHYCCENMNQVAYHYYLNVKEFYENKYLNTNMSPTKLFLVPDKYNFFVPYYMILIGDKVKDYKCVIRMYEIVFIKKQRMFIEFFVKNLLYNLQFFFQYVSKENTQFVSLANDYIRFLYDNNVPLHSFHYLLNDVYKNAGIVSDYLFVKEVTNKPSIFSEEECAQSKNVLIYTGFCDLNWNYSYALTNALGGSEKAVAYLSHHLSKDYTIYVSGSVNKETVDNIHYVPLNELINLVNTIPFHTVIVSRYVAFYEMFPQCSFYQSYIWAHDTMLIPFGINTILNEEQIVKKWNKYIKGCVCLTEWHKNLFAEKYPGLKDKIHLINNGIEPSYFYKEVTNKVTNRFDTVTNRFDTVTKRSKVARRFIYTSRPDRGLNILVALWPSILKKLPDATLVVSCYGDFPSNQTETIIKENMDRYDSIRFLGKLNATQLYEEMASAEYWLYPTNWPETSCITALEMLMSDVICIYYPVAGLVNTMDQYGIQVLPEKEIDAIMNLTEEKKSNLRKEGRLYAENCSWVNRGKIWNQLLGLVNNDNDLTNTIVTPVEQEQQQEQQEQWLFFLPLWYTVENLIDYFDSLSSKYNIKYTKDKEYACSLNPSRVFFVFEASDLDVYNYFYGKNIEICIFNSEPLNLIHRLEHIKQNQIIYSGGISIYDYSLSNIKIMNEHGFKNTYHLPYLIYDEENNLLKDLNKTQKIYDFGIILDKNIYVERRSKVVDFLINHNYSVKVIHGWKEERDKQLAQCSVILNIHGANNGEISNIFEHIRCDRLLAAGFQVLSEDSWCLDESYTNNHPNLKMLNYEEFFNVETYTSLIPIMCEKKKIIDCFIFYNELDMLEYRLNVLNDVVDYFVLVEANHTFVGRPKPLFYNDNKHLFEKFNQKIIHIVCDLPFSSETIDISKNQQWVNEKHNRSCIKDGLKQISIDDRDLIIIADVDEIPDPNTLRILRNLDTTNKIMALEQDFYYYNLNSKRHEKWYFSKIISYDKYRYLNKSCDEIRNSFTEIIPKGGWHFSYFGDTNFIKNKIENFAHQEYNSSEFTELATIEERINNCVDLFNRGGNNGMYKISAIDNDYLPPLYDKFVKLLQPFTV